MLLKNIQINSLNLLSFVYIVVFDVETALENIKLAILEGQNCKFHYLLQIMVGAASEVFVMNIYQHFAKTKMMINDFRNIREIKLLIINFTTFSPA